MTPEILANGLAWYVVFLFSITVHEAAHAFAAMKMGDDTAYNGGQVTLNPAPHVRREPFGTVIVPILSYFLAGWMMGWASAPYNPHWALQYPKRSAIMSLAGPASNLVLVFGTSIIIRLGVEFGFFVPPERLSFTHLTEAVDGGMWSNAATILSILFSLNLLLFAFNLIPVPPLDGSGALPLFMSEQLGQKYMSLLHRSGFAIFGIFLAWQLFTYIYPPIHLAAINLLYPGLDYH
ncbi:MAG: site-2 protease family protein [Bacteroidetes bacterium]|nr:site-2 protease family protein [Bacteroidota bacterium]MCW5894698.1 site-2 protease family protein [Bacteroidota bacterium]